MKKIIKYIALGISLLASSLMVHAQNDGVSYNSKGGVSTNKTVVANGNGGYTITLETFATGTTTPVYSSTPVDVVLVLDYSRSMTANYKNGKTRIQALKDAVGLFVDEMARNDVEDDDGNPRDNPLGNRVAVVTFDNDAYNLLAEEQGAEDGGFLSVSTSNNVTTIKDAVNDQGTHTNTNTHLGMSTGETLVKNSFNNTARKDCNRVLVLFTDGNPGTGGTFSTTIANQCITSANTIKNSYKTTIYVVGLVEGASGNILRMMNSISSNYPNATSMTDYGSGGSDKGYYQDATQVDLEDIFDSIAKASGGSAEDIGSTTQIRDQASSSFVLPSRFNPSDDVTIEVYDVDEDGMGWTKNTSYDVSTISKTLSINSNKDTTLVISGFDYSKDDIKDENGYTTRANAGNWVGPRYLNKTTTFWAGKKIVVKFDIYAIDGATGGDATGTNAQGSGVYVWNTEKEEYECVNEYTLPTADLPINIKITKDGLRHGESATFEIHRFKPLKKMPEGGTTPADSVLVYNAINKPVPNPKTEENWTKVIITNKGADGASVTKTLLALDPSYIYSVIEDDWGWAYELTGTVDGVEVETGSQNTSIVAVNPFTFHNKEKANTVKHAEAVTINHFATSATGKSSVETYKSSKVKSF